MLEPKNLRRGKFTTHAATIPHRTVLSEGRKTRTRSNKRKEVKSNGEPAISPLGLQGPGRGEDGILKKSPSSAFLKARFPMVWRCSSGPRVSHTLSSPRSAAPPQGSLHIHMSCACLFRHIPVIDTFRRSS